MSDQNDDDRPRPVLSIATRSLLASAGAVVLGAGVTADYLSKPDSATVAVIVVGGLLSFVGLSGIAPKKVTIGDNSLELGESVKKAVDVTVDALNPDQLAQAASTAVTASSTASGGTVEGAVASRLAEHSVFQQEVLAVLRRAAQSTNSEFSDHVAHGGDQWDGRLRRDGRDVFFEAKLRVERSVAQSIVAKAGRIAASAFVVVVARDVDADATMALTSPRRVIVVVEWRGDELDLAAQIESLLGS